MFFDQNPNCVIVKNEDLLKSKKQVEYWADLKTKLLWVKYILLEKNCVLGKSKNLF